MWYAFVVSLHLPFEPPTFNFYLPHIPPSRLQLLSADSTATKVIQLAEKRRIFVWFGRAGFVGLATAGLLTTFALDLLTVVRCINAAIAITVLSGVRKGAREGKS